MDRLKDMIIRGGENIYPVEIENRLYEHAAIVDAAVAAIPHRTLGEEPAALVTLASGAQARAFSEATKLFTLAESLGGVESLLNYPDAMTHASVRGTELAVPETLVRLSVGIEGVDDLLADIDQALSAAL